MISRYSADALTAFAAALLSKTGLDADKAATVASILVEGDLLGRTTHGLQQLGGYLKELEAGKMAKTGGPRVLADYPAALSWDGMRLPGPWLTVQGIDRALERAKTYGTATVVIRRSHHIACLAAYLPRVTEQGMMIILVSSDPSVAAVAPYGGTRGTYTPNPIAAAWPTAGDPVLLDFSQSITTLGNAKRLADEGRKFPGVWAIDAAGNPSDDPAVIFAQPGGSILPTGGIDHGHKGYALALLVEALTGGLAGFGRADPAEGWGATVYIQVFDPALFGGRADFLRQTTWTADACRTNPPRPGVDRVRVPGEGALRFRERQVKTGVELYPAIMPSLLPWAQKFGVAVPATLN